MVDEDLKSKFIRVLNIKDYHIKAGIGADGIVMQVYEAVSSIWEEPRLHKFADHGLRHSYRVLRKSLDLALGATRKKSLCPYERTILGMATLLHDIGMQYGKYYCTEALSPEQIREQHCELGMKMVMAFLQDNERSKVLPVLVKPRDPYLSYLYEAAGIAFAHADEKLWQQLCKGGFEERRKGADVLLRPQLLAALLRYGDELDMGSERVPDVNLLKVAGNLTAEEMAHWCACYYVNAAYIDLPESGGIRIEIVWRVPKEATDEQRSAIRMLISRFRAEKAEAELAKVEQYLISSQRSAPPVIRSSMRPKPELEWIDPPPLEVVDYIESITKTHKADRKPLETEVRPLEVEDMDKLKRLATDFFEIERPVMFQKHVALRTKWHTNTFLQCRNLVAKRDFAVGLANSLSQSKEFSEANFTDVLAFGTSSIRLGSIIALALNTRLSYTFLEKDSYMPDEWTYDLSAPGCRVLVLDDILGVGSVANKLLKDVFEKYKPKRLDFLVIYLLGKQTGIDPEIAQQANILFHYLVHRPEVTYFEEDPNDKLCEHCRAHPDQLVREDDLLY